MKERRVAIYARVSTEHEAQLSALENQVQYYDNILNQHPEWKLYGRYIDEGITVIEWPEYYKEYLPKEYLEINFKYIDDNSREILFKAIGDRYTEILGELNV